MIFTITKSYKVFRGDSVGEPMDEQSEDQLYAWLRTRGYSEAQAAELIKQIDEKNEIQIDVPVESVPPW